MTPLSAWDNDETDSVALASNPQSSRTARSVAFAAGLFTFHEVLHINDYSDEEINLTWYDKNEIQMIKAENKAVANMINHVMENENLCFRGLENRQRAHAIEKRRNKANARALVFLEQEIQKEQGAEDPEALADIYYDATQHCQVAANMMGLRDERDARGDATIPEEAVTKPNGAGYSFNKVILGVDIVDHAMQLYPSAA